MHAIITLLILIALSFGGITSTGAQSDATHKNTVAMTLSSINSFMANNRGAGLSQTNFSDFERNYLSDDTLSTYQFELASPSNSPDAIIIHPGHSCDGTGVRSTTPRRHAVTTHLSDGSVYCADT